MEQMRKLPIGIQTFEEIRRDGYLYVDKTAMVYQIANVGKPIRSAYNVLRRFVKTVTFMLIRRH
ncbi:AAA family ATPase [Bacteroides uniformis]|uniref:AAA family ATPase n=1 Tax=Bacteroides uniformis TaxID=820 RepID=UPI00125E3F3B|nr:AAA family ATPase [Bacteroides uniformis]